VDYNGHPPDCNDTGRLGALPTWRPQPLLLGEPQIAPLARSGSSPQGLSSAP